MKTAECQSVDCCETCLYWTRQRPAADNDTPATGKCRESPEMHVKQQTDWCGRHKASDVITEQAG